MKKIVLVLCAFLCLNTCAFARPDMKHDRHVGPKHKPNKIYVKHVSPRHHYKHMHRDYCPYSCYSPHCIHRSHLNTYFQVAPGFSIGISI